MTPEEYRDAVEAQAGADEALRVIQAAQAQQAKLTVEHMDWAAEQRQKARAFEARTTQHELDRRLLALEDARKSDEAFASVLRRSVARVVELTTEVAELKATIHSLTTDVSRVVPPTPDEAA